MWTWITTWILTTQMDAKEHHKRTICLNGHFTKEDMWKISRHMKQHLLIWEMQIYNIVHTTAQQVEWIKLIGLNEDPKP